jgi:hypothetical protein
MGWCAVACLQVVQLPVAPTPVANGVGAADKYTDWVRVELWQVPTCSPVTVLKNMMLFLALERISQDCGLSDIIPRVGG